MEQSNEPYDDEDPFGGEYDPSEDVEHQEEEAADDYDFDPGSSEDEDSAEDSDLHDDEYNESEDELKATGEDEDSSELNFSSNYGSDKINKSISQRLSRARYNKINLELISDLQPKIRVIPEDSVFEIMKASLGNSVKVNRGFRDNYSTAERYSTFLTNYNLGSYRYDPSVIMFRPSLFSKINHESDSETYIDFIKTVDSAEYLEDIGIVKCLSSKMKWGIPDKILSTKSADYIKKIFSIELLNEELQERIRIQKKLELLMAKYESTVLSCYDKLSYLKSSDTKTQEEYDVDIKIGMMHVALEKEGYEDIFYNQVRRGVTTQIPAEEINELKRLSLMRQKIEEEVAYIQKPIPSLFETYGGAEFKISNYDKKFVSQKLERIRKYLEETNSEGVF